MASSTNRSTLMDNLISADSSSSAPPSNTNTNQLATGNRNDRDDRFYNLPPDLDHIFTSIAKRIYAQINVIVLAINTISAVFSISAAVSLIQEDDDFRYDYCDYGHPVSIGVQCPYLNSPGFIVFFVVWTLYFLTVFTYKFHRTIDYWTHDFRFYLLAEATAMDLFIQIMVKVGVVLTLVSSVAGFYFVVHNGTTASIGSIFVFSAVNLVNLKALGNGKYAILGTQPIHVLFPKPMYIKQIPQSSWKNLHGALFHPQEVLDLFVQLTLQSYQFRGTDDVSDGDKEVKKTKVLLSDFCHKAEEMLIAMKTLLPEDYVPNK